MFNISKNKSLLQELTCKQCSEILSVLPVYYCSAIGNICGRCVPTVDWMISNGTLERAVAYEAVAKFLVFPCINGANGCQAKLKIDQVAAHEKTCSVAPRSCPFNVNFERTQLQCKWKGDLTALIPHLKSNHENHHQTGLPSFVMNVSETHVKPVFTTAYEHTFLVVTKYLKDTRKFYVTVVCCAPEPCNQLYRFQVEVGRNNDYFLILRKPNVEQFRPMQEIVNNDNNSMVAVDVNSLLTMLDDPTCLTYCRITIFRNPNSEINQITPKTAVSNNAPSAAPPTPAKAKSNKKKPAPAVPQSKANVAAQKPVSIIAPTQSQAPKVDHQHLEELECPVCNLYMTAPIYICPMGHSLCNKCKLKLQNCPLCRTPMQDTRNYSLEQLTRVIKVPCCYAKSGCTVSLNTERIKLHELHCNFAYGKCPLKFATQCNTDDIVDLVGHIREKHSAFYFETNRPYFRAIDAKISTTYWATTYENEIFIICCKHGSSTSTGPIKFAALHVGMNKSRPQYHFELEFCDQTRTGMKLIINQLCKVFPINPSSAFTKCLSIPMEMLQPFVVMKPTARLYFKFILKRL